VVPRGIELIERTGTQSETFGRAYNIYSLLQAQYGTAMGAIGNFDVGERILRDCRQASHQICNLITLAYLELFYGWFYYFKGDGEKAVEHHQAAAGLCEKTQFLVFLGLAWGFAGYGYLLLEQAEKALEHLEKGLRIHLDHGMSMWLGSIYTGLGLAHLQMGNLEPAQVHAKQGLRLSRTNNERYYEAEGEMCLGRTLGAGSSVRFDEAKEHILRGIKTCDELKIKPKTAVGHFHLGELSASSGRTGEAMEHLQRAEVMFRQMGMGYWLSKTQQALAKL
jgi:tetratricopeptide (TPR) repeat protein